jgi:hypothetical protein
VSVVAGAKGRIKTVHIAGDPAELLQAFAERREAPAGRPRNA